MHHQAVGIKPLGKVLAMALHWRCTMGTRGNQAVSRALTRDLRRQYAQRFRVVRADSGPNALEILRELRLAEEQAALHSGRSPMPGMTGIEFLEESLELFPDAKRVLLTAYADIDAAMRAINAVGLDYYLLKPWDPPEEKLYPVLDELIDDWQSRLSAAV